MPHVRIAKVVKASLLTLKVGKEAFTTLVRVLEEASQTR